ncbi:dynein axonemal assembly factor 6 [Oratosquilla oratoria]|uniref:dynein axonemal assembly factor 6 n=1 Tax=Oratosquilla oratoria TaxID=337810 RepID=UPI003F757D11
MQWSHETLKSLSTLLRQSSGGDGEDNMTSKRQVPRGGDTPASLVAPHLGACPPSHTPNVTSPGQASPEDPCLLGPIWTIEELLGKEEDVQDHRIRPEYQIQYRQRVGSQHVFLPVSGGRNAVDEDFVIRIKLPKDNILDLQLDIKDEDYSPQTESLLNPVTVRRNPKEEQPRPEQTTTTTTLTVSSNRHYLYVPLPERVNWSTGNARWCSQDEVLEVNLPRLHTLDRLG